MEKQEILAKVAELLTAGWVTTYGHVEFELFSQKTDKEKRIDTFIHHRRLPCKYMYKLYRKENNIVLAKKRVQFAFMRNRFFPKSDYSTLMTITPKRVFCNNVGEISRIILKLLNCNNIEIKTKRELRNLVIKGELPPETTISYDIYNILHYFGPTELETYTTNKRHMIDRLVGGTREFLNIILDMIPQCKALDVKINSEWSCRRIMDQHQRWNDEINKLRHRNCSEIPIWNTNSIIIPNYIELINSEKRCAEEGDNMHHCLYNCYWMRIKNKSYMAFHIKSDTGDFTVGVIVKTDNTVHFDQAYKAYNKSTTEDDRAMLDEILRIAQSVVNINIYRDAFLNYNNGEVEEFDWDILE